MKKKEKVFREVRKVTQELIRCGLAEEYNFPIMQNVDVVWEKYTDISCYLKNTLLYNFINDTPVS